MNKNVFGIVAVVLALGVAGVLFLSRQNKTTSGEVVTENDITATYPSQNDSNSKLMVGTDAIYATDQLPGKKVTIPMTVFANTGYVVIHKSVNGEPGVVIGNSDLIDQSASDVEIALNTETKDGEEFFAMLHTDDGDGVFEFPGDDVPTKDTQKNIIMMNFKIDKNASENPEIAL